jgi:hypothetical protein
MKTLIALSIAIASLTFQVQAQSDTIKFNATIPTKNLSMDEVHGILMNYLALKCDNWMQVIQLRNTSTGQITLYLKLNSAINILPFYNEKSNKRTHRITILSKKIILFSLYDSPDIHSTLSWNNFNSTLNEIESLFN